MCGINSQSWPVDACDDGVDSSVKDDLLFLRTRISSLDKWALPGLFVLGHEAFTILFEKRVAVSGGFCAQAGPSWLPRVAFCAVQYQTAVPCTHWTGV